MGKQTEACKIRLIAHAILEAIEQMQIVDHLEGRFYQVFDSSKQLPDLI